MGLSSSPATHKYKVMMEMILVLIITKKRSFTKEDKGTTNRSIFLDLDKTKESIYSYVSFFISYSSLLLCWGFLFPLIFSPLHFISSISSPFPFSPHFPLFSPFSPLLPLFPLFPSVIPLFSVSIRRVISPFLVFPLFLPSFPLPFPPSHMRLSLRFLLLSLRGIHPFIDTLPSLFV